jgi:hypothetical protein
MNFGKDHRLDSPERFTSTEEVNQASDTVFIYAFIVVFEPSYRLPRSDLSIYAFIVVEPLYRLPRSVLSIYAFIVVDTLVSSKKRKDEDPTSIPSP